MMMNRELNNVTFGTLGLDSTINFLKAPMCDCGGKQALCTEDIKQATGDMLSEQKFDVGGILVFKQDGDVLFTLKIGQTEKDIYFCTLDMSSNQLEECGQVLQKSLQCMEEELGVEKNALVLKHCGVMVEIEKDTFKIIEE